jgi:hypothetical protein
MATLEISAPNEKQKLFFNATHKYIGFGGARGGGKSWAVRVKAIFLCLQYAGIKCMIIRKTYAELTANHITPMIEMLNCYAPNKKDKLASYNDAKKTITFPNGSTIIFRYCDNEKDAERFQGTEVDILFVDEATHQSEDKWKKLTACVRGVNSFPKRIYATMNPGSEGHAWVKRLFIDRNFRKGEKAEDYVFIQSKVTDNTALMRDNADYVEQLEALPPALRKMWLEGDWDVAVGAVFEEFRNDPDHYNDRRWTHVINPFEIPDHWKIYRGFDFGYNKPFSCQWFAVDGDGVVYNILELYGCQKDTNGEDIPNEGVKWTPQKIFSEIHRVESEHRWLKGKHIIGIADPACWNAESGESVAETASKHQVYFTKGDNNRLSGWMQMHYRLAFDENGYPMMYIFKNCRSFIRTIPLMMYDEHKPEDIDSSLEDHNLDSCRYFLMSRPIKPRIPKKPNDFENNPMYMFLDIKREDITTVVDKPRMTIIDDGGYDV